MFYILAGIGLGIVLYVLIRGLKRVSADNVIDITKDK